MDRNFSLGCANCGKLDLIKVIHNKKSIEGQVNERITYEHVCSNCSHVIAEHEYNFSVVDMEQEYEMNCLLCGVGEDTVEEFKPK